MYGALKVLFQSDLRYKISLLLRIYTFFDNQLGVIRGIALPGTVLGKKLIGCLDWFLLADKKSS